MVAATVRPSLDAPVTSMMAKPVFGYSRDGAIPHRPTFKEIFSEFIDSINFTIDMNRGLIALNLIFHIGTGVIFANYVFKYLSPGSLIFVLAALVFIGTFYNTIWFHRYCSHVAFKFSRRQYALILSWTSPLFFRESTYAIPHRVHHQCAEKPGDPYGPHLGWLGSYFAIESSMKLNPNMTQRQYELICRSVNHIGLKVNSYASYQRTGSIEDIAYYLGKTLFAQVFWSSIIVLVAGEAYVFAWYSSIFLTTALIRDFNWRGHGGNFRKVKKLRWEYDTKSRALNQHFYGYIASEWHDNHHKYPFSANNGFLPGQFDIAFQIIKLMHRLRIVESYVDAKPLFENECLGLSGTNQ